MRIGFFVNDMATEQVGYTTTRLAMTALNMGHEAWHLSVDDFIYAPDESIYAIARRAPKKQYRAINSFFNDLTGPKAITERIRADDLDILMLRNDPSDDALERPWAQSVGISFGQFVLRHGVVVVNDPGGLARAANKLYFQAFPAAVRPRTIVARNAAEIKAFIRDQPGGVVMKPLQGSGGQSVFLVRHDDNANLNQMIEAVGHHGYIVVQEYLPAAAEGDVRLFLMNGSPLIVDGHYAAFRRVNTSGDLRSNLKAGGAIRPARITPAMLKIADAVRPKLVQDGMFLVGLDIAGDKLMEINVFSPGGLGSAQKIEEVDFAHAVIIALERKAEYMRHHCRRFNNVAMATL